MTAGSLRSKRLLAPVKWLFAIVAVAFLLNAAWASRFVLRETVAQSEPRYLLLALAAYVLAHFLPPLLVINVLRSGAGASVGYPQALGLHFRYLPARYLPGGIWHTVARVHRLHDLGVRPRRLTCLVLLENLMAASVALAIGGTLLGAYPHGTAWSSLTGPVAIAGVMCLASLPFAVNRWVLAGEQALTLSGYATAAIATVAFWICMGVAFLSFVTAFPNADIGTHSVDVVGAYLFAWGIGFVAVFAPQGIGVFEIVAADLLPTSLSFQALAALLAGFRLVSLLGDLCLWLTWFIRQLMRRV